MTDCNCSHLDDTYPELVAKTNHFRQGAPRSFSISAIANRALFVRSKSAETNQLDLWMIENLDKTPSEKCVVESSSLFSDSENLSAAERARRERLRESGAGITSYSTDELMTMVTFPLSGQLWISDFSSGGSTRIGEYESVVDPKINRRGDAIAFTDGSDFVVYNLMIGNEVFRLSAESETVSYGLADFVSSEELSRYRGHWWAPNGDDLLVQRTDEAKVAVRWISDPTHPDQGARAHRYPMAGETNPEVSLFYLDLNTNTKNEVVWDRSSYEYLEDVDWTGSTALITLLSRNQRDRSINTLEAGKLKEIKKLRDSAWLDCGTGSPRWGEVNLVTTRESSLAREILIGDVAVDLGGRHVDSILAVDEKQIIATVYNRPWELEVVSISTADLNLNSLSDPAGFATAITNGNLAIVIQHDLISKLPKYLVKRNGEVIHTIKSLSVEPPIDVDVKISQTSTGIATAVVWPKNHIKGSHKLPVIVAIYGGPHHSEVTASRLGYADDQWLANQGFCVVVIDNRGTPGQNPAFEREVLNDLSDVVLLDQVAALQELANANPDMDLGRVGIHGWSFGGFLSALAVLDRPDIYKAAWAGAPVTDWALYDTAYTERYLGHPTEQPEVYKANSLIEKAHKLERPLMLIHGLADDNVLAAHSLQFSGALLAAGRAHQFLPLAGVSHMTPQAEITKNLMLLMREFFRTNR
jgi:dipeptidyl-peptidase 4